MNCTLLTGRLSSAPKAINHGKGIKFSLQTRFPSQLEGVRTEATHIPCIVYDANILQRELLLGKDYLNLRIELAGRIHRSIKEDGNGGRVNTTEVIANPGTLMLQKVKE